MSQMLDLGKVMIRICASDSGKIEYSTNNGRNWYARFNGSSSIGEFEDLIDKDNEIIAMTTKGTFYSTNAGRNWYFRSR